MSFLHQTVNTKIYYLTIFANVRTSILLVNDFGFVCFVMDWFQHWRMYIGMRLQCCCIWITLTGIKQLQMCHWQCIRGSHTYCHPLPFLKHNTHWPSQYGVTGNRKCTRDISDMTCHLDITLQCCVFEHKNRN